MSLRKAAASGIKWTSFSSITIAIFSFINIIILAKILEPEDFGLVGMVLIVIGLAKMLSDVGFSAAIVHTKEISQSQLSSLYWFSIIVGLIIFIILILSSSLVINFFEEPRLKGLIYFSSINFIIVPIGQQFRTLLQKHLKFNLLAKIEIISHLFGFIVSIFAALKGAGAYAIVFGQITNMFFISLQSLIKGLQYFKPQIFFSVKEIKGFIYFGITLLGQRSINYFNSRVDQLLIGKLLGATELGYYTLAFNLVVRPMNQINPIVNRVAFPIYAKIQEETKRLKNGYFEALKIIALINFPILFGIVVIAPDLIEGFYGNKWAPSIKLVQILAFIALFRSIMNPIGSLFLAKGKPELGLKMSLIVFFTAPLSLYLSTKYGTIYIAFMLLFLQVIYFNLSYIIILKPLIGVCKKELYLQSLLIPGMYSSIMGVIVYLALSSLVLDSIFKIIIGLIVGVLIYMFLLFIFEKEQIASFRKLIFSRS